MEENTQDTQDTQDMKDIQVPSPKVESEYDSTSSKESAKESGGSSEVGNREATVSTKGSGQYTPHTKTFRYDNSGENRERNDNFEKRNEYSKDRDSRYLKYKKFDKIATKKYDINYKKPEILREFLTEKGKILPRSLTGTSAKNQRKLTQEVKRSRFIGLLPSA